MKRTNLFTLFLAIACTFCSTNAQNRTIRGVVISATNDEPLIGASIFLPPQEQNQTKESLHTGVSTDVEGKFTLSLPNTITQIKCSYIGFQEQTIYLSSSQNYYTIKLQPAEQTLEDFVVTGYQEVERRKLTAAISKIDITEAMVGATKSIDQALAGQIAGVSVTNISGAPGTPARIRIRGTASLNGTQDPLWVLDGIPLEGTDIPSIDNDNENDIVNIAQSAIAGISPNDIENITILKDAAATAIYGARAANGVIVITTKKGRIGKPQVNFNTKFTFAPNLNTSRLNLLNAEEKVNLELELLREAPFEMFWGMVQIPVFLEKGGVAAILKQHNLINSYKATGIDALSTDIQEAINTLKTINTNWNDILFRDAFTQEYNLSISGGSDKVTYYNSLGFTQDNGNVRKVSMTRINLTSKTNYRITNKLNVGLSIFANRRKNTTFLTDTYGLTNPVYYSRIANPYFIPLDIYGHYLYDYDVIANNETDTSQGFNILEEQANTDKQSTITSLNSILNAELVINKHWKANTQVGIQWDNLSQEEYAGENSFNIRRQRINSQYFTNGTKQYLIPEGGMLKNTNGSTTQITWKSMIEYYNQFNNLNELQIMAGSEIRKNWVDNNSSLGYGYNPKTLTFKPLIFRDEDQAQRYTPLSKTHIENAFASFFANGSYTIKNRYTLGASIRIDGSDLFGVDKKYRYLPIYSASGLWRVSEEPFFRQQRKKIEHLALRISYGLQGNIDKNTSPYLIGTYGNVSILPSGNETNITINSAPNSKLRWEKTTSYNIGVDLSTQNRAINISADYYYRKGTDLIGNKILPHENGFTNMSINWASMENNGLEVNLQTRNIATKNFSWYSTINFAYNKNKILKIINNKTQTQPDMRGYPIGAIFALKTKGINSSTGQILIEGPDGQAHTVEQLFQMTPTYDGIGSYNIGLTTEEEKKLYHYIGTTEAPYSGGILNSLSYRNWELNLNLSYNIGAYVRNTPSYDIVDFDPGRNTNRDILQRWTTNHPEKIMPALATQNNNPADYALFSSRKDLYRSLDIWVKRLSFMRLQNIRVAYRVSSNLTRKLHVKSATISLEGRNLFVISSDYTNYIDPESMGNLYSTPVPKSFSFGLNINF